MPAVSPTKLVDAILRAIQRSGGSGFYMSERPATHPRELLIQYGEDTISLWVYIWTLTHGGRRSLSDEYRIQMTSVSSPLSIKSSGHTVLLGYHAESDMFAGFEALLHESYLGYHGRMLFFVQLIFSTRYDWGLPRWIIRLRMAQPKRLSTCWLAQLRAFSLSPMRCL